MNKMKSLIQNFKIAQSAHSCVNLEEATAKIFKASKNAVGCQSGYIKIVQMKVSLWMETIIPKSDQIY